MSIRGSGVSFDKIYTSNQQYRLRMVYYHTNVWVSMWFTCIIALAHQTKLTPPLFVEVPVPSHEIG